MLSAMTVPLLEHSYYKIPLCIGCAQAIVRCARSKAAAHLIPLPPHLAASPDVRDGVHKPPVYEAQLVAAEPGAIRHLIRPIPAPAATLWHIQP